VSRARGLFGTVMGHSRGSNTHRVLVDGYKSGRFDDCCGLWFSSLELLEEIEMDWRVNDDKTTV